MVHAATIPVGVCPRMVSCQWNFLRVRRRSRRAGRWRCVLGDLPHVGIFSRGDHLHVPAPPGQYCYLCGSRLPARRGRYRISRQDRQQCTLPFWLRPWSQLLTRSSRHGPMVPAWRRHRADSRNRLRGLAFSYGGAHLGTTCGRARTHGLGTNCPDHRGLPSPSVAQRRDVCPSTRCRCPRLWFGRDGLRTAKSMDRGWHPDRSWVPHSAIRPPYRDTPVCHGSSRQKTSFRDSSCSNNSGDGHPAHRLELRERASGRSSRVPVPSLV